MVGESYKTSSETMSKTESNLEGPSDLAQEMTFTNDDEKQDSNFVLGVD